MTDVSRSNAWVRDSSRWNGTTARTSPGRRDEAVDGSEPENTRNPMIDTTEE
jgi:hypothetical protein